MLYATLGCLLIAITIGILNEDEPIKRRVSWASAVFCGMMGIVFLTTAFMNAVEGPHAL